MSEREVWDEEKAYDERIFPLMAEIIAICKERRIPMFASFAFKGTEDGGTEFCTTNLPDGARPVPAFAEAYTAVYRVNHPPLIAMTITSSPRRSGES